MKDQREQFGKGCAVRGLRAKNRGGVGTPGIDFGSGTDCQPAAFAEKGEDVGRPKGIGGNGGGGWLLVGGHRANRWRAQCETRHDLAREDARAVATLLTA